jgi:outer membrane protein
MKRSVALALGLMHIALLAAPGRASAPEGLSPADMFTLAQAMRDAHRPRDAEAIFDALAHDPDPEIRAEARFRKGMLQAEEKHYRAAAVTFRALLDEKPNAARVRLELARMLALMGNEVAARRAFREAEAAGLPPDLAIAVDRFARSLPAGKPLGGSMELSFLPDTNINRATNARMLDTVIAPLTLSDDARSKSGLGIRASGQGYLRLPLNDTLSIVPRLSGQGDLYRQQDFDDISGTASLALEWQMRSNRITPSVGESWRWYGQSLYARTQVLALGWLHPTGPRGQLEVQLNAGRAHYVKNPLQSGGLYSGSLTYERALSGRTGASLSVDVARQAASDPGYATWSGGGTLLGWRTMGRTTLFASVGLHRLVGDERLFLFPERRSEWFYQASVGATLRRLALAGFAPLIRLSYERNRSTVGLYDYHRLSSQVGVTRAF